MKKILLFFTISLLAFNVYGQKTVKPTIEFPENVNAPLTKKEKAMIKEVYQSKANEIVFNNEDYLRDIKHLLRNRITIYEDKNAKTQKNGKLLSDMPLLTTYNKNLKRDTIFDISNFNPLKYQLDFFANGTYVYRIDNTNYFIQVISQYRKNLKN